MTPSPKAIEPLIAKSAVQSGKKIETLIQDIYNLFESDFEFDQKAIEAYGKKLAEFIAHRVQERKGLPSLRMSNLGTQCLRKLWYMMNQPEKGEKLDGQTRFKFLYGDIIESLVLFLAEASGHKVEGGQATLDIDGVLGHRDAIIDGVLVDVKSASTFGFKKFAEHGLEGADPFGYLDQINAYLFASQDDPELIEKKKAAFLAVDKTLGKMALDVYPSNGVDYKKKVADIRLAMVQPTPPPRSYEDVPHGKSGNKKLGMECSYCAFKETCWPGLETFVYSTGPVFLTKVAAAPRVQKAEGF